MAQKGSAAEQAGFQVKDLMDGTPLWDEEMFSRLMFEKRRGDAAEFQVKRGAETLKLVATLRRRLPAAGGGSSAGH